MSKVVKTKAKRKDGISIIKKNVGKFQSIVDGLDKGINLCDSEISTNSKSIIAPNNRNEEIGKSMEQAVAFQGNLRSMLAVPQKDAVEEKKED
jgi:hypothetical protein